MKRQIGFLFFAVLGLLCPAWAQDPVAPVKNVIWVISDGMGPEIMGFFMQGVRYGGLPQYPTKTSVMETLMQNGTQGLYFNNTYDTIVTDSAASATQMATGQYSRPDFIGLDYNKEKVQNLLELAQEKGKAIGIVSDAYVTDATPAGFTAHTHSRRMKTEIAAQQINLGVDVISGGGLTYFDKGLLQKAHKQGYTLVKTKKELSKVNRGKLLGLFSDKGMPYAVEMGQHPQVPSLAEQTGKALELLSKNPEGFVLMVEAGKVDWAAHANDPGALWAEMKNLDATLEKIFDFAQKDGQTLVYVNADHDTGLGAFSYQYLSAQKAAQKTKEGEVLYNGSTLYHSFRIYALLDKQKRSLYALQQELESLPESMLTQDYWERRLGETLGYSINMSEYKNLTDVADVLRQLNKNRGFVWATGTHSSAPLIGVAYGPRAELFSGVYHNTDIFVRMKAALGWSEK